MINLQRFQTSRAFGFKREKRVRRTNFDKKMLIDKHFVCRRAYSHRFGATHACLRESPNKKSKKLNTRYTKRTQKFSFPYENLGHIYSKFTLKLNAAFIGNFLTIPYNLERFYTALYRVFDTHEKVTFISFQRLNLGL